MGDFNTSIPVFGVERLRASKLTTLANLGTALTDAWTAWTPTLTNLTLGSGSLLARYRRIGKSVDYIFNFTFGSGSAVGTNPQFTLPVAPNGTTYPDTFWFPALAYVLDSGTTERPAGLTRNGGSALFFRYWDATPKLTTITATAPWTWATGDRLIAQGSYEAA